MTSTTMASDLAREALEPISKIAEFFADEQEWRDHDTIMVAPMENLREAQHLTVGDLRRARSAYDAIGSGVKAELRPGDIEPHNDIERTVRVVRAAYGWTIDEDGRVAGLVAGDMGYESTHIVIPCEDLAALSTHTATGAVWVGEAVTTEMVNAAWNEGKHRAMRGSTNDFRRVLEAALSARPVEEPGEMERLMRERDEAVQNAQDLALDLASAYEKNADAVSREAALAETRERLEKREAALREIASAPEWWDDDVAACRSDKTKGIARAALTGDAQEAGK